MIVVSDTTPLRYLAILGLLELLPRLFGQVFCPGIVLQECCHPRAPEVLRRWAQVPPGWLLVDDSGEMAPELLEVLDAGEAAAITLAQRLRADLILIDEKNGRHCTRARGFSTAATLNLLAQAGIQGWVDYRATAEALKSNTNFRITQAVIDAAWQAVQPP
ncbi:MAG: hypothetical protein JWM59_2907 [Verrucomicrobiales bacterium]|nr:hypothetical protein [Verrucomicrobiales bacterium]